MSNRLGKHLVPPLARPQYVSIPEGFISALAWHWMSVDISGLADGSRPVGLRYRGDEGETKYLSYRNTEPAGEKLISFGESLAAAGLISEAPPADLASAVANSILGIRAPKGKFQPATPVTFATAMLQNMRGIQGAANPPDLAGILETMFSLGLSEPKEDGQGLSSMWASAVNERLRFDPILRAFDVGVGAALFDSEIEERRPTQVNPAWAGVYDAGPFKWLVTSWTNLTSLEWVSALPARVWTDWAATVLRLAYGLGFLWESAWFDSLARLLLRREAPLWDEIEGNLEDLMPWFSSTSGVQTRDVASRLMWRAHRGARIRELISEWIKDHSSADLPVNEVLVSMNLDANLRADLTDALSSKEKFSVNLWESIRYALMTRESKGQFADYYGLWRNRGSRYLVPEPGVEWTAVVASLTSDKSDTTINLGLVTRSLEQLGACPDRLDLVSLLEEAGLARGSADADQGVSVATAY